MTTARGTAEIDDAGGAVRGPGGRLGRLRRRARRGLPARPAPLHRRRASGKADSRAIAAEHFTLSVMFVPPGQGNAPHTHEVEEAFFVLDGKVRTTTPGAGWRRCSGAGTASRRRRVVHGFENVGLEPAYIQVIGRARPDLMSYVDAGLQARRDSHLAAGSP